MYYVHGEPLSRINKKFTALIATLAILMNGLSATLPFMMNSTASASSLETIYNSIPSPLPSNLPSQGYQASSTKALGDKITFMSGTSRNLSTAEFTMSSWACETGSWNADVSACNTTDGATFNHPITLNLYNTGSGDSVGTLIQSLTQTFSIPFRPSADPTCSDTRQWKNSAGNCFSGITHNISFDLSGITVPDTIIFSIEFNTMTYGNTPLVVTGPYDSLNLALTTDLNAPFIGTDVDADVAYWDSTYLGRPAGLSIDTGWTPYKIAAKFNATAPTATTLVVTGNTATGENQPGWLFNRDVSTSTPYEFNANQHSIGTGSLNVLPIGATPADKMVAENFVNSLILDVHSIKYDFKIGAGGDNTDKDQFYMNIYANFGSSSPTKFYDCRYNIVPVVGSTTGFTTVIFDPSQTYSVATSGSSPHPCPSSPDAMNTLSANSRIRVFSLNVGDTSASDTGLDGYLDNVVVRTTATTTIYDFEPFVNNAPVVTFVAPTTAENSVVSGVITPRVLATDDYGMGSYYIRLWKGAFESGITNLVSNNCSSAPGAFLLGTTQDITCPSIDTTTLDDGTYVLSAQFLDGHIVWGSALRTFTVDNTAPEIPVHVSPANNAFINYNDFWFEWSDSLGAISYETQYSQNPAVGIDGAFQNVQWTGDYQNIQPTDSKARSVGANGTWYWQVRAVDSSGLKSAWTSPWKITIDMVAPAVPMNLRMNESGGDLITNGGTTNSYGVTARWDSVPDANSYEYRYWNSIPGNPYNAPNYYVTTPGTNSQSGVFNQGQGLHHFQVLAIDAAGNKSNWSSQFDATYDTTAPDAPNHISPSNGSVKTSANQTLIDWSDIAGVNSYVYQSSTSSATNPDGSFMFPVYTSGLLSVSEIPTPGTPEGTYFWHVKSVDAAGNESVWSAPWKVIIDNTPPAVTVVDGTTTGNVITPAVTATDANEPLTYSWNTQPGVTVSDAIAKEPTFTVNADGLFNFTLTATDLAGNQTLTGFSFTYTTPVDEEETVVIQPANTAVQGATTLPSTPATTAFTNVSTTNSNNQTQSVPVTETGDTEEVSGEVEGTVTENFASTTDDIAEKAAIINSSNLLGLGWWWIAVLLAVGGLLWFLLSRNSEDENA